MIKGYIFAKLFDTPSGQLLATRDFDGEADQYRISLRGEGLSYCDAIMSYHYETEEARDEVWDQITQHEAEELALSLANTVKNFFKGQGVDT